MISIRNGTIIAGKYRLEEPLARGGMGAIWVARHIQLDVLIAVKFIDPDFATTAEGRARFEREAKSAAMLHSPNVVQIHDYGVEFETPYLVMELLQGEDLSARLKREERLSLEAAAKVGIHVSKALRKAHEAGVIHRDLKPSNIFIVHAEQDEDEEIVKVLDFGVAKRMTLGSADADETKRGALIGSPRYMSPEQARRNREVDHRSDLWSLGVILFRAVTGQLPFPGDEVADVLVKICSEPLPLASQIAPDLGAEVDRFFARALARDPAQRFQSAREMALDFAALVGASTATSRFSLPIPSDRMRVSWTPGMLPFDYTKQSPGVTSGGLLAGKTPLPSVSVVRSQTPTPTLTPEISIAQVSLRMPPVSHPPVSVTTPSPSPPSAVDGMGPSSFKPVSETIPLQASDEAGTPGSAPTHMDATLVMADRRAREPVLPRAEVHRRSDPAHGSHRASDAGGDKTAEEGRRLTPPTHVVDEAIDETRRSSVPALPEATRRSGARPGRAAVRVSEPGNRKGRDSRPGIGPSATLTSSNGTVDIPPGRASVRARRALALGLTLVAAITIGVGAVASIRLGSGSRVSASAGPAKGVPSNAVDDAGASLAASPTSAPATPPSSSAAGYADTAPSSDVKSDAPSLDRPSAAAASAAAASKPASLPAGGR